ICTDKIGAKVNDLSLTAPPAGFTFPQLRDQYYTHVLQTQNRSSFNPYGNLIHAAPPSGLKMQAYAFSIDDAIGFQSYPGDGIIITLAGCTGLSPCQELDPTRKIVVNMGVVMPGIAEWNSWGPCSNQVSRDFDPAFASALFYAVQTPTPQSPC